MSKCQVKSETMISSAYYTVTAVTICYAAFDLITYTQFDHNIYCNIQLCTCEMSH